MLSSISWSQYVSTLAILLICYYAYVGYKYYHWELLGLIGIKKVEPGEMSIPVAELKKQFTSGNQPDYLPKNIPDADISPVINSFEDEVRAFTLEAGDNIEKAELLNALQQIMVKYPVLKSLDSHVELNEFILMTVTQNNSGLIDENDIQQLWALM